jgi:tetratricopeptide (TPR) repeat protein
MAHMISLAPYSDAFVGRHRELELLHEESRSNRGARFIAIEGEAGIGKSRLVREFVQQLENTAVAFGQCVEQIRRPYLPIEQLLEGFARRLQRPPVTREGRAAAQDRAAYFEDVADAFRREAMRKRVVLVLEDVHWADETSIELLRYLTSALSDAPILVIMTMRPFGSLENPALAALRLSLQRARGTAMTLNGLRRNDTRTLIARMSAKLGKELEPQLVTRIETLCDGNPLFAEELTRIVVDNGEISFASNMPLSAQAMLSERLSTFTEAQRGILVRAAIVGQTFSAAFVAEIAGIAEEDVLATAQRAFERDILLRERARPGVFTFRHSLIRQALADQLVVALAAPLHLRIAEAIEQSDSADARADELAHHYGEARDAERARRYYERAAQSAWTNYAYRDAIRYYIEALKWEYPAGRERAAICERLGMLFYIDGVGEEPLRWFRRAHQEYENLGDAAGMAYVLLLIGDQQWVDARTSESLRSATEAAAKLERLGKEQLSTDAMLSVARFAITLGNAQQAAAQIRSLARRYKRFEPRQRAAFHEIRAEIGGALGDAREALADSEQAVQFAAQTGSNELIAQTENNAALVAFDLGELDRAISHHERALEEAHRTGLMWRVGYSAITYAQTLMWRGDLKKARTHVIEALECGVTTATFKTKVAAVGIPLALMMNDRQLLAACADEEALEFAERSHELQRIASVGAAFAELRASQGSASEAETIIANAITSIPHGHRAWNLWITAGTCGRPEDVALARTLLAGSTGRSRMLRAHAVLLAALGTRNGDEARVVRLATVAKRLFALMGFR